MRMQRCGMITKIRRHLRGGMAHNHKHICAMFDDIGSQRVIQAIEAYLLKR